MAAVETDTKLAIISHPKVSAWGKIITNTNLIVSIAELRAF